MSITVSKENIIKNVDSYMSANFSGVTSSGDDFIQEFETQDWFVYDKNLDKYVFYNGDPRNIFSEEQIISNFRTMINIFLQDTAISFGYDSIQDPIQEAISYYNSSDSTKREEARSFSRWRDSVEFLADANIFSFTADGVTLPDLAGFTGQTGYTEFSVVPIPTTFFGDEDAGYHITDLENRIFTAWINVDHQGINSGLGQSIQIPFPSGNITDIHSISGIVDQGSQTSDWLNANYSLKIKFSGTANSYGVQTEFDYMIHSLDGYATTYNGLVPRFTIIGGY